MINPAFNKVSRLSALSFENEDDRTSYSKHYTANVEIKDYNVLTDDKSFLTFQQIIMKKRMKKL